MDKSRIVILVKTKEEIEEVYNLVMEDMSYMFHPVYYDCEFRQDYAKVESTIHNITIELLNTDFPYAMKGRRANLVVLKDFFPANQDVYFDVYNHMVCIGGYVIDYKTFTKHHDGSKRNYMRYDVMVNCHYYETAQWKIEKAIGIERKQLWEYI